MSETVYEAPRADAKPGETIVTSTCGHNCGGRCVVNAHVSDGRIVHISTDARRWDPDHPPLPACARGVGQIERTYHPDRLKYPMRRIGARGSGEFERITWDQALDTVAQEMLRIRQTYGNAAILDASRTGSQSMLHGRVAAQRFLNMFGGCTDLWSNMSAEAEVFSVRVTYGSKTEYKSAGREPSDFINSRLILMWGWSPGDGTFGTGTMHYLKWAKKNGTRIVCVDPRQTMTSRQLADEHVFIRPSTDAAALIAMAYVIVSKNLHDQACDLFNQCPNVGKMAASLAGVEFFVAQDHFLTPTARLADIVLPATTFWERNDVHTPWAGAGHYAIYMRQAIEPMYECRNDIDIFDELLERMGIAGYSDKTETEWLRELTADAVDDFDVFREQGVARFPPPKDAVAFAGQIRDPENHKFSTPSGKIEVYSMTLAAKPDPYGLGVIPPIPTWISPNDDTARFPLSLCTPKSRARTHSIHGNQPGLARVDPDTVWMHPEDAASRGIIDGQRVRIFNDIGATVLPAQVTERIVKGVVSIKEGAWFVPGTDGIDTQGCANVLTTDRTAPCGATTYNTMCGRPVGFE